MSELPEHHDRKHAGKRTEVFVGGLPRAISEDKIREVFSSCGEILEVRMIKDQKGALKGFCFVRFATKEAAGRAVKEVSGIVVDGKKIGVLPSTEKDTLYFGNLHKGWSSDEFEKIVLQIFPDVVSVDLAMLKDKQPGQKQQNRGFAFVKFSSQPAAARALRAGSQPDFRLGNLHPAVQWAEEEPELDLQELAEIKIAFVRNLPVDLDEKFLKQYFDPFGKVEKVVVSKKGSSAVGFVHFTERSDLDKAVKEMNGKTIRGPTGGSVHKLQVEVARPMNKNRKRVREEAETSPSVHTHSKLSKEQLSVTPPSKQNSHIQKVFDSADPYEEAVIALPLTVKERLLRILRLGIATRFDIDVQSLHSLKELPESSAISVLDQFMLSGAASQDKGAYLTGLISKYLFRNVGSSQRLVNSSNHVETDAQESKLIGYPRLFPSPARSADSHAYAAVARPDVYASHYPSRQLDYPSSSRAVMGTAEGKGSGFNLLSRASSMSESIQIPKLRTQEERIHITRIGASEDRLQIPRMGGPEERIQIPRMVVPEERIQIPRVGVPEERMKIPRIGMLEERMRSYEPPSISSGLYGRRVLKEEERRVSPVQAAHISATVYPQLDLGSSSGITPVGDRQATRPQVRFDPFTGRPYKFDPFTGEPILPGI